MKIEIKCIVTATDGEVLQEYTIAEFETAEVYTPAGGVIEDAAQN